MSCPPPSTLRTTQNARARRPAGPRSRNGAPTRLLALLLPWLLTLLLAAAPGPGQAQTDDIDRSLDDARTQLDTLQKPPSTPPDDTRLIALRDSALGVQQRSQALVDQLTPRLTEVEARLAELGPLADGATEAPEVAVQRRELDQRRQRIDAQIKRARLLAVEADQAAEAIYRTRRAQFQAQLGERTPSVLSPRFWDEWDAGLPRDRDRLARLGRDVARAVAATPLPVWIAALGLSALIWWAIGRVSAGVRRWLSARLPRGQLHRSVSAAVHVLFAVLAPALIALLLRVALTWRGTASAAAGELLGELVAVVCFGSFVAGLGRALLSARDPDGRLLPLSDDAARALRRYPQALGAVVVFGWLLERLNTLLNGTLATAVAIDIVFALALLWVLTAALRRGLAVERQLHAGDPVETRPLWVSLVAAVGAVVLIGSAIGVLAGYVALASFVLKQVVWIGTVVATAYLLCLVIDDAFMALADRPDGAPASLASAVRNQALVLLSGIGRVLVVLAALVLIASPFGQGPSELLQQADHLRDGISLGQIQLQPATVLQAVTVFALAMLGVRVLQRWLTDRFLPTTRLDAGMRASASTLLGFVGTVVAVALALSAIGLGLERIAWVASALSVGIGFGLQAIVSNFVSGLILLAERPVKVGDWVTLGGVEGDIRRINVRATEIQLGDKSTMIVPNSEFITKAVRNVTHAGALGQVQMKLALPIDTDAEAARVLMLGALTDHPDVLDDPAPNVFLDGIEGGTLVYNIVGNVASPRQAYGVKSALWFEILKRLRDASMPIAKPPMTLLREAPAPAAAALPVAVPRPGGADGTAS